VSASSGVVTALIYTRVSTEDQAREGVSLDAQVAECRRYAARQGWALDGEYQDVLSGKRDDRPQYQALLRDVRRLRTEGCSLAVVVAALDRLGRKILERVRCREELKRLGVPVYSVREGGEVSDLVANVLAAVAEEESRRLAERISAARDHIAGKGWHKPSVTPWGYVWREATPKERAEGSGKKVLDIDPLAAPYVREAFQRAADGQSLHTVARWIAELPDAARGGRSMPYTSVRRILRGWTYAGYFEQPPGSDMSTAKRGRWPAIVDEATWLRTQERIWRHRQLPRQASGRYLLTGFLRCERCGGRMVGCRRTRSTPPSTYPGYGCTGAADHGASAADLYCRTTVSASAIERLVLGEVVPILEAVTATEPHLQAALRQAWLALQEPAHDIHAAARRIQGLEREVEKARQRLATAALKLVDGELDKAGYDAARDRAQQDLQAAQTELERLRGVKSEVTALPPLELVLRAAGGWPAVLKEADVEAQRDVLAVLIEQVVPKRIRWGVYEANITWSVTGEALRAIARAAREAAA
jgi:DNA invertase Pin-like site-specific DNA recombinase